MSDLTSEERQMLITRLRSAAMVDSDSLAHKRLAPLAHEAANLIEWDARASAPDLNEALTLLRRIEKHGFERDSMLHSELRALLSRHSGGTI